MSEDAAFIRAIRDQPDDETARLVYADWLDDRSDPRAEYLRTEAAWVALESFDDNFFPLFRRVSQLAAALASEWFAAVSRFAHSASREWASVAHVWEPHTKERTTEPVREWHSARQELVRVFSQCVGVGATEQRFCVPADYLAFLLAVGGGWHQNEWDELFSASRAARRTVGLGTTFADKPGEHLEIWVNVAITGDKQDFFLCCDLSSPRFGEVAEGEDYHPWMDAGVEPLYPQGDSFLEFLWSFSGEPEK